MRSGTTRSPYIDLFADNRFTTGHVLEICATVDGAVETGVGCHFHTESMQAGRYSQGFDGGVLSPYRDPVRQHYAKLITVSIATGSLFSS
jgi:hypothetical protein